MSAREDIARLQAEIAMLSEIAMAEDDYDVSKANFQDTRSEENKFAFQKAKQHLAHRRADYRKMVPEPSTTISGAQVGNLPPGLGAPSIETIEPDTEEH